MSDEPDLPSLIRASWEETAPTHSRILSIDGGLDFVLVGNRLAGTYARVPVAVGDDVSFGRPEPISPLAARVMHQSGHHFGYWPGDKRHRDNVAAANGEPMPNPHPDRAEQVRTAWNTVKPVAQWIVRVDADTVLACDEDAGRAFTRVPYEIDDDGVQFGQPQPLDGVPVAAMAATGGLAVYATRAESRPDVAASQPAEPNEPPAAEPEQPTEPKEDPVSTLSEDMRSRLGLADDADEAAALAAIDALKTKADTPPTPDPQLVAASAAATKENEELRAEVKVLASQVETMSAKLADAEADRAATVKASVLDEAQKQGKFTPADREQWDKDYDDAPAAVTRVLAKIAPGTAVPVTVSGETGTTGPEPDADADWDAALARLDGPTATKGA